MTSRLTAALLIGLLVSGCALFQPAAAPAPPLIAPRAYATVKTLWQQVRITHAGKHQTYNALLKIRPDRVSLIWFGPLGARLFQINWDGHNLRSGGPAKLPPPLTPDWLIADIQAVYAPLPALRAGLASSDWRVASTSSPYSRVLARNGKPAVRVSYPNGPQGDKVTVQHLSWRVDIRIDSRAVAADHGDDKQ